MGHSALSVAARLRREFTQAAASSTIGGSDVLAKLGRLASACIIGTSNEQDAVAFALSIVFEQHANDKDERAVTGDDAYQLLASGEEVLSEAVMLVEKGGTEKDPTRIVAALARLIPDRLYQRWPPEI